MIDLKNCPGLPEPTSSLPGPMMSQFSAARFQSGAGYYIALSLADRTEPAIRAVRQIGNVGLGRFLACRHERPCAGLVARDLFDFLRSVGHQRLLRSGRGMGAGALYLPRQAHRRRPIDLSKLSSVLACQAAWLK